MSRRPLRVATPALVVGALGLVAAACGGGSPTAASSQQAAARSPQTTPTTLPGAFGQIAAVSGGGTSLEVQNPQSGQVTVNVSSSTTIIQLVTAAPSDLAVGDCVTANGPKPTTGPFTATAVTISQPGPNGCARGAASAFGGGGFGGGFGRGFRPNGGSTSPRNPNPGRFANLAIAAGKVTSVSGASVDVQPITPPSTTTTRAGRTPPTFESSFTYGPSTRWTKVVTATPSAFAVGQCVAANGPSDSTGAVTAQTITIRPAGPNGCFGGFGAGRNDSTPGAGG
ncbi:MAG TPA: DUF5666 domain-containing protein [Acidimicrobiales bacterium]|nr:DUF5666 domain-containing protein [Acidimicrobiales bacterium]